MMKERVLEKIEEAKKVIEKCKRSEGFMASTINYRYQLWTRDLVYSLQTLAKLYPETCKKHLENIFEAQKNDGNVPTMILNFGPIKKPFYNHCKTYDSDILAAIGMYEYVECTKDYDFLDKMKEKIEKIDARIRKITNEEGFVVGRGWMDAMKNYTDKICLTTQAILFKYYKCLGMEDSVKKLKEKINERFYDDNLGYYTDYLGGKGFDTLGNALLILFDIPPKERIEKMAKKFTKISEKFGCLDLYPPYEFKECGQRKGHYQNSTIWPFIQGYVCLALIKANKIEEAKKEFVKFTSQIGFNEWYDSEGRPRGSRNQLWSAAMYLVLCDKLKQFFE